ncbi:MAG: OsmC family protein [bacterium]
MNAELEWLKGMTFVVRSGSGHRVVMDTKSEGGGENSAPSPMENVLMALLGCTAVDVIAILKKKKLRFSRLQVLAEAERAADHPRVFTSVTLVYRLFGDKSAASALKAAVALSQEKYCSVSAMVRKTAKLDYSLEVVPDAEAV